MQLDDYTLSLLCTHVFDVDLKDRRGRTPLQLAICEGRDVTGQTDSVLLKACVDILIGHKPEVNYRDNVGESFFHLLAAGWQYDSIDVLNKEAEPDLIHCISSHPDRLGMTALHCAVLAQPIKRAMGEGTVILQKLETNSNTFSDEEISRVPSASSESSKQNENGEKEVPWWKTKVEALNFPHGATTVRSLLRVGARPNLKDANGRTALQLLMLEESDDPEDSIEARWGGDVTDIGDAVIELLTYGARIDANDTALQVALKSRLKDYINIPALIEKWNLFPTIDADTLGIR